jgi:hypothetical protein
MAGMDALEVIRRPALRRLAQVAIVPGDEGFEIHVNGQWVMTIEEELDAHHWAKHVTECVHSGVTDPRWVRECLPRICETATRANLHTGFPAAS